MSKKLVNWIVGILVLSVLAIAGVNIFLIKTSKFWEVSIAQVLTLLVAILIAFWAAQRRTDERKIKEQVEKITNKIQTISASSDFYIFNPDGNPEEVQKNLTMTIRKLKNATDVLRAYSKHIDIQNEVNYIDEQIRGYNDFVSAKVLDLDYLSKSETHLRLYADNISSKCDYIILKLFTEL